VRTSRYCFFAIGLLIVVGGAANARDLHYGAVTDEAVLDCDRQQWRGAEATACYEALLTSDAAIAAKAEAAWALGDRQVANRLFRTAMLEQPDSAETMTRWADLFAASHQDAEAMDIYREALDLDADYAYARLGAARVLVGGFNQEANAYLHPLLTGPAKNGATSAALLLMAKVQLENGDLTAADTFLDRANDVLSVNTWPSLELFALRRVEARLNNLDEAEWIERASESNPNDGRIHALVADALVLKRRYREAIDLYQLAVDTQPDFATAHEALGITLLRDNQISRARQNIEAAFELDPFSPRTVNTLRLLDSFSDFRLVDAHDIGDDGDVPIVLRLHETEAEILTPYVTELIRQSITEFSTRYAFELEEAVVVELYPDHDDFAVRTAGMPGLGILGVAFGYLVAMDSPSGRPSDQFQWGTTLWHEMAHVFTLGATDHRVPRWFSEGISVYEEWRSGPTPGRRLPSNVLKAIQENRFLAVAELDEGFIRPSYEGQVIISYHQAGLICQFIESNWGSEELRGMLVAYRDGGDTSSAIESVLGVSTGEFDEAFQEFLDVEVGDIVAGLPVWETAYHALNSELQKADWKKAIERAASLIDLDPDRIGPNSAYLSLARALRELDRGAEADATLETWWRRGGFDPEALLTLAHALHAANRHDDSIAVYATLMQVDPLDADVHGEFGELLMDVDRPVEALREFRVALALDPHDQATAWTRVAQASLAGGDREAAEDAIFRALDVAPNYRPAQRLLLELTNID
jgi:tetratricopeptide (TPR) repeat protein